jgi:hypothetical protein
MFAKLTKYLDDVQPPILDFNSSELTEPEIQIDDLDPEEVKTILSRIADKIKDPEYTQINLSKLHFKVGVNYFSLLIDLKNSGKGKFPQSSLPFIPNTRLNPTGNTLQVMHLAKLTESFNFVITSEGFACMQSFSLKEYMAFLDTLKGKSIRKLHLPGFPHPRECLPPEFLNKLSETLESLTQLEELKLPQFIELKDLVFITVLKNNKQLKRLSIDQIQSKQVNLEQLTEFLTNLPAIHYVNLGSQSFLFEVTDEELIRFYFNWLHQEAPFTILQLDYLVNLKTFEKYFSEFLTKQTPPKTIRKVYLDLYGHVPDPPALYNQYMAKSHCWIFNNFSNGQITPWRPVNLPTSTVNNFLMNIPSTIQRNLPPGTFIELLPPDIMTILHKYYCFQDESFAFDARVIQAVRAGSFLLQLKSELLNDFGAQLDARSTIGKFFSLDLTPVIEALQIIDTPRDLLHWQVVFRLLMTLFEGKVAWLNRLTGLTTNLFRGKGEWTDRLAGLTADEKTKAKYISYVTNLNKLYDELNQTSAPSLAPSTTLN